MSVGSMAGTDASVRVEASAVREARRPTFSTPPASSSGTSPGQGSLKTGPAVSVEISDAGRAALAAATSAAAGQRTGRIPHDPAMRLDGVEKAAGRSPADRAPRDPTTGLDVDYRLDGPAATHSNREGGPSRAGAMGAGPMIPGRESVGGIGPELRTAAQQAAHAVQRSVRAATADLDGDGRADVSVAGSPAGDIKQVVKAHHDTIQAAIQNLR